MEDNKELPEGFIGESDDYTLIAIRGTATPQEGLMDLIFMPVESKDKDFKGKYHRGFLGVYEHRLKLVLNSLSKLNISKDKPIIIGGHSLGAAAATLVAYKLSLLGYNVQSLYAISSPRVGDSVAWEMLSKANYKQYQLANYNDIIAHLPMSKETTEIFIRLGRYAGFGLERTAKSVIPAMDFRPNFSDEYRTFNYDYLVSLDSPEAQVEDELDFWSRQEQILRNIPKSEWVKFLADDYLNHDTRFNICMIRSVLRERL